MDRKHLSPVAPADGSWLFSFGVPVAFFLQVLAARAAAPHVQFDVVRVIGCRDVTTPEFAASNPRERLVRAVVEISSLVQGDEEDLFENRYQITVPDRRLRVVDYEPRTTPGSDYAGNVQVEQRRENSQNATLGISGGWKYLAQVTGGGDAGAKRSSSLRYELLPPMEAVAASGTLQRGGAVYFKLKRMRQSLLEGSKPFAVTLRVPHEWRAGYLHVHCEARGQQRAGLWGSEEPAVRGEASFLVAVYLEGDGESQRAATQFIDAAIELGRAAARNRQEIRRQKYPTVLHEFGALLGAVEPQLSDSWLSEIIYLSQDPRVRQITRQLPSDVRLAANHYLAARETLDRLGVPTRH